MDKQLILTRKDRQIIYKSAFIKYKKTQKNKFAAKGMCFYVIEAFQDFKPETKDMLGFESKLMFNMDKFFPELYALKPKNLLNNQYWWSIRPGNRIRINKFKQLIKRSEE